MKLRDKIFAAFKSKDENALNVALAEVPDKELSDATGVVIHNHISTRDKEDEEDEEEKKDKKTMDALDSRMKKVEDAQDAMAKDVADIKKAVMDKDKDDEDDEDDDDKTEDANREIEGNLEEEAPPGTSDGIAAKAKDSAYLAESFQETVALGEIISPGIGIPTFDSKADPRKTYDGICQFRRRVLDLAYSTQPDSRSLMDTILKGRELKTQHCSKVRDMFIAVGTLRKNANAVRVNDRPNGDDYRMSHAGPATIQTPADMNKAMADYYKNN